MDGLNIVTNYSESDYVDNVIRQAAETGAVIVCQSNAVVDDIRSMATKIGVQIQEPIPIQWLKLYEGELILNHTPVMLFKPMSIIQHLMDRNDGVLITKERKNDHLDGKFYTAKKHK